MVDRKAEERNTWANTYKITLNIPAPNDYKPLGHTYDQDNDETNKRGKGTFKKFVDFLQTIYSKSV